jgi:hypothetical protein
MSKPEELDESADYLRAGISIHPDALIEHQSCLTCMDGDCSTCGSQKDLAMTNFLRPRMPFPSL